MARGQWLGRLALIILLWATLYLYAPAVSFGFIWDDPVWFGHASDKSWWQTLLPNPNFQFYRPLTMLYFWLFQKPDGTFAVELLHWSQISWHLLSVTLAYAVGRRLGLERWPAWGLAALLAVFPLAYQSVAWAAPQQPLANVLQSGACFAYLIWRQRPVSSGRYSASRRLWLVGSLLLFGLALLVQESSVAVAFVPLLYEFLLHLRIDSRVRLWAVLRTPVESGWVWAVAYLLAAYLFSVVWLLVPRQSGITGLTMQMDTAVYLSQVFIYPLLGRPWGYAPDLAVAGISLLTVAALGVTGLLLISLYNGRGRLALLGLLWGLASMMPFFTGLDFTYVELADRLFYAPALGVLLLWYAALWPQPGRPVWRRYLVGGGWLLIVVQSVWLLLLFSQMYRAGTDHLQTAIVQMSKENGRYLFINFPDRYLLERPFYPVGLWGVTLAPVVVDLADFLPITTGITAQSTSYSMPWLDTEARADGPYQVDMRGVIIQPDELYRQAQAYDMVYVSRYDQNGHFHLEAAGSLQQSAADACSLVQFDDIICLHGVQITPQSDGLNLALHWSVSAAVPPHTTMFVHAGPVGRPPLVQADGDSWRGLMPLTSWQPGYIIRDERTLVGISPAAVLTVQIGIYNWVDGTRWPAALIEDNGIQRPLSADFYQIEYKPDQYDE